MEPDNLVLLQLRELRAHIDSRFSHMDDRFDALEKRLSGVESGLSGLLEFTTAGARQAVGGSDAMSSEYR